MKIGLTEARIQVSGSESDQMVSSAGTLLQSFLARGSRPLALDTEEDPIVLLICI